VIRDFSGERGKISERKPKFMQATSRLLQSWHSHAAAKSATPRPGSSIQHQSGSVEQEQALLTDELPVRKALLHIVIALEDNFHAREDLLQEASVCFWSRTRQFPGKRLNWYLKGVKFYLQHLRTSGRSLDSPERRGAQALPADNCFGWDEWLDSLDLDKGIMSEVNAHDIFSLLVDRLGPIDGTILSALAEGIEDSDIAEKLHVSQMFVIRHRRVIAKLAIKLGIHPVAASPLHCTSSKKSKPDAA